jgi:hypothetical protein
MKKWIRSSRAILCTLSSYREDYEIIFRIWLSIASERVAIKAGYKKEGMMRSAVKTGDKYFDMHLYAKVKDNKQAEDDMAYARIMRA